VGRAIRRGLSAAEHSGRAAGAWLPAVSIFLVLGVVGSVLVARSVARSDERAAHTTFVSSSSDIVARLRLALRHEEDFAASTSAFLVTDPNMSNATFARWLTADHAFTRYPEIPGVARIVVVTAAQLPAYAARAVKNPVGSLAPDGSFFVTPAGSRPYYCFVDLSASAPGAPVYPAGLDYCATAGIGPKLLHARDSGQSTYEPYTIAKATVLAIQAPIYRGGAVPSTVAARRASFIGLAVFSVVPAVVINAAEAGRADTRVALRFSRSSPPVVFQNAPELRGGYRLATNLHNGWTVTTSATAARSGVFSHRDSLFVLAGGLALTLLAAVLGLTLTTGRARALRLVAEQTSELQAQAERLRATVDELTLAQAVRDEFMGSVSHELRSPLTSIRGYSELLQDEELTPEQRKFLQVIESNSDRLLNLVEDLLLMTQIQSGGMELQLGQVVLADVVDTASEAARPAAVNKKIDVEVAIEPEITTRGDSRRLGQAIDNLVSNAIKYTPAGGRVAIKMSHTPESATIAISDTGIGIPAGDRSRMFDRFFRASNAVGSSVAGTGLGLAITRGIVEAHGGTISFDSVESVGSTFSVTLPRVDDSGLASAV
jgi:signal transduction histidine kinase